MFSEVEHDMYIQRDIKINKERLNLPNGTFYPYNSCALLDPIYYHIVSGINIDPSIFCSRPKAGRHRLDTLPEVVNRNSGKSVSNLLLQFIKCACICSVDVLCVPPPQNKNT